jgi:type VI secretion system VasD/TssJ family lipoprotein
MMEKFFRFRWLVGVWAIAVVPGILACGHAPPAPPAAAPPPPEACATPEPVRVTVTASSRVNLGEKGEALATVVRLYQLKGRDKLASASFDEMLDHDKDTLGEDLLAVVETTISPGESVKPPVARNPEARYLAVVALFRKPGSASWRAVTALPAANPKFCHAAPGAPLKGDARFFLDENRVELR